VLGLGLWPSSHYGTAHQPASTNDGHSAFEKYREKTLQRLDQEQREFQEFIVQLRRAKDKAEFEQFMAERRARPPSPQG
jgi:Protein of unknown function (DUF2852)